MISFSNKIQNGKEYNKETSFTLTKGGRIGGGKSNKSINIKTDQNGWAGQQKVYPRNKTRIYWPREQMFPAVTAAGMKD